MRFGIVAPDAHRTLHRRRGGVERFQHGPVRVIDQLLQHVLGPNPVAAPKIDGRCEEQCETCIERLAESQRRGDSAPGRIHRLLRQT